MLGLQYSTSTALGTGQTYNNSLAVTNDSTINVSGSLVATMGGLSINGSMLSVASDDISGSPYSLTLGTTTLTGNATFNVTNSAGGGSGTLRLGAIGDGSNNFGISLSGGGKLELTAANTYTGPTNVNSGTLRIDAGASIKSTAITISAGGTLQLAGTTGALPATANIKTNAGSGNDGAVSLTGAATESIGTITGQSTLNSDSALVYTGSTTVGDGSSAASLTATQILQNTLTINANSTVTIAPSAGAGGGAVAATLTAPAAATFSAASASSSDSGSDAFTAIQAAIADGSISSSTGQRLENRISAIERLASTDPGLDASLLENRVLAALPTSSILPSADISPLADSSSNLLAADSSAFGSGSSGSAGTFASAAGFTGSPAAVPEPSTLLLAALGGLGLAFAARRRSASRSRRR